MLVAAAFILLAGVIIYNVVSSPVLYRTKVRTTVLTEPQETETDFSAAAEEPDSFSLSETMVLQTESYTDSRININEADAARLQTLKGIGASKAQAIIDYRTENGNFSSVDELTNVSGIGEKTLAGIKDQITV